MFDLNGLFKVYNLLSFFYIWSDAHLNLNLDRHTEMIWHLAYHLLRLYCCLHFI